MKTFFLFLMVFSTSLFAQNFPFPQGVDFPNTIKPNNVTQLEMNETVATYYDNWKINYLTAGEFVLNSYYIAGDNTGGSETDKGTSEGHGWGMMITVLMAGYDEDAQEYYNGLYRMFDATRSSINSQLMAWLITENEDGGGRHSSAADGDMDIAYSLILAHHQWGSNGEINYIQKASEMIVEGLKSHIINSQTKRIMLGDWDNNALTTRSSDWMAAHLRAYYQVTGEEVFSEAANEIYSMINTITTNFSSNTGLMPDFIVGENPAPAEPNFLESDYDGDYYYNSCRYPWRIVTDFAHYSTPQAKDAVNNILNWLKPATNNNPSSVRAGYTLDGEPIGNYFDVSFTAPFVAAAIADATHQQWLNDGWSEISTRSSSYYPDSINLLVMLLISGNWWAPPSDVFDGQFRLSTEVEPAGSGVVERTPPAPFYEPETEVELTAVPALGYEFSAWSGDVESTQNPVVVTINQHKNIVAIFTQSSTSDITIVDDCEDGTTTTLWGGSWYSFSNASTIIEPAPFEMSTPGYNSDYAAKMEFSLEQGDYQWSPYSAIGFSVAEDNYAHNLNLSSGVGFYYKSSHSLSFRVELSIIEDYAYHAVSLPASIDWRYAFFQWSDFSQPGWGEEVDFDLELAENFSWYVENQSGVTGELWVDDVFVQGDVGEPVSVKKKDFSDSLSETVELDISPNPFNPIANINISIPNISNAELKVFDVAGKVVKEYKVVELDRGVHSFVFDGSKYSSGVYFVRFTHSDKIINRKMILLK